MSCASFMRKKRLGAIGPGLNLACMDSSSKSIPRDQKCAHVPLKVFEKGGIDEIRTGLRCPINESTWSFIAGQILRPR
jgi:hypothetical protein